MPSGPSTKKLRPHDRKKNVLPKECDRKLTPFEYRFCEEFIIDMNIRQSENRAGGKPGTGNVALDNPYVIETIRNKISERSERTSVTADQVIYELALIAFSDIRNYTVLSDGSLSLKDEVLSDQGRAVQSLKQKYHYDRHGVCVGGETEIKMWPKVPALETLAKHMGLVINRHEVTGKDGGPVEMITVEFVRAKIDGSSKG